MGTQYVVNPLDIPGFIPEKPVGSTIPQSDEDFVLSYRYLRNTFDYKYITGKGATKIRAKRLYFEQEVPKLPKEDEPVNPGYHLSGWIYRNDDTGKIMKETYINRDGKSTDKNGNVIPNVALPYFDTMPAHNVSVHAKMKFLRVQKLYRRTIFQIHQIQTRQ